MNRILDTVSRLPGDLYRRFFALFFFSGHGRSYVPLRNMPPFRKRYEFTSLQSDVTTSLSMGWPPLGRLSYNPKEVGRPRLPLWIFKPPFSLLAAALPARRGGHNLASCSDFFFVHFTGAGQLVNYHHRFLSASSLFPSFCCR